ncbi:hypothetical protein FRC06_001874 [Ceratobasidium sp. 370]|nr:hypothetical protein FRC06_001874 [Ceratobasidium sp. 370]
MRAAPAPLIRTDTRLDLALDLKHKAEPSPITPRAHWQAPLKPPGNLDPKRTLKRTESYGKARPLGPTTSIGGVKSHQQTRDTIQVVNIPPFDHPHEDDDNVGLDSDTLSIAGRQDVDAYVGAFLEEARLAKTESVFEIVPNIEMIIEGGRHIEVWDAKPDLCARINGCVSLSRKTMRALVDGRNIEIVLRGIAVTASTVENPRRCENNHYDAANPQWHVGGLSGGQQVEGRAVWFGNGTTELNRARLDEFNVPFHIDIPLGLLQARRDRVIVVGASAIFGSTHRPDVVRRVETEVLRLTLSNLCSSDVMIPMWR